MGAWQQGVQQQQAGVQAALGLLREHVQSSIQTCRLKLAQLQQWLTHPDAPHQQEVLCRQLQEAEEQLVQFRRDARECELEVQRAIQQQLSGPPLQDKATQASDLSTEGTASPVSSNSNSNPVLDAAEPAQHSGNGTSTSMSSKEEYRTQPVGAVSDRDWATSCAAGQGPASPAPGAWASRGGSLWQPAGGAISSTATVTPAAPAVTRLPSRSALLLHGPLLLICSSVNPHHVAETWSQAFGHDSEQRKQDCHVMNTEF